MLKIQCTSSGYSKNQEIFIQYGKYSNRHLLSQYGFAVKNNKYDYYSLKFRPQEIFSNYLQDSQLEQEFIEFKLKNHGLCDELLKLFRAINWNTGIETEYFFGPGNAMLDKVVLEKYRETVENEIRKFATTEEEDEILIKNCADYKLYFSVKNI